MFLDWSRTDISKMLTTSGETQDTAASELENHEQLFMERLDRRKVLRERFRNAGRFGQGGRLSLRSTLPALRRSPPCARIRASSPAHWSVPVRLPGPPQHDGFHHRPARSALQASRIASQYRGGPFASEHYAFLRGVFGAAFIIAFGTARQINRRLADIIYNLKCMAGGDLTHKTADGQKDELGEMTHWLNDSMEKLRSTIGHVASSAQSVTVAVEGLNAVSQRMSANSEETSSQATRVSSNTEQVTSSLETVASSTEQMSSNIKEIAKSIGQATQVAGEAVKMAQSTNQTVSKLGESSVEIGNVIKVIMSIAQQTNLLALNATIEAARAGEAGKGFAVVAQRSERIGESDGESHGGHQPQDRGDPGAHGRISRRDRQNQRHHCPDQ